MNMLAELLATEGVTPSDIMSLTLYDLQYLVSRNFPPPNPH